MNILRNKFETVISLFLGGNKWYNLQYKNTAQEI